ncbi:MAG TPA: hypothetical protein VN456_16820, partial [Desulfosporosinus sp.]|nr:hypothetical protein [Desulfosporosinus sp.]
LYRKLSFGWHNSGGISATRRPSTVPSRHHGAQAILGGALTSNVLFESWLTGTLDHPWSSPAADRMTNTCEDSVFGCQPSFLYCI